MNKLSSHGDWNKRKRKKDIIWYEPIIKVYKDIYEALFRESFIQKEYKPRVYFYIEPKYLYSLPTISQSHWQHIFNFFHTGTTKKFVRFEMEHKNGIIYQDIKQYYTYTHWWSHHIPHGKVDYLNDDENVLIHHHQTYLFLTVLQGPNNPSNSSALYTLEFFYVL